MHLGTLLPLRHLPLRLFATTGQLGIVDLFVMFGSPCSRIAAQRSRDGGRGRRLEIIGPDSIRPSQPRPGGPEGDPVRRRLRHTDRGPVGSRRPRSVVPAEGGRPCPSSVPVGLVISVVTRCPSPAGG